jgi:hypothetical protein
MQYNMAEKQQGNQPYTKGVKHVECSCCITTYSNKNQCSIQVLVVHTCNPSYSGGRDQKYCDSKPAWANSSKDPILKKPFSKKGLME